MANIAPTVSLPTLASLQVDHLGTPRFHSPLNNGVRFIDETNRVLVSADLADLQTYEGRWTEVPSFERAGPRSKIFFDPKTAGCGIVTCGGLCPGLNDVIRAVTLTLRYLYGVERVYGFRYGYAGLGPAAMEPIELDHAAVQDIHNDGGTVLGSSRGPQDVGFMVEQLVRRNVRVLFTIGGDGTLRGASALAAEIARLGHEIAVVAIPKTIDNDLMWTDRSFGFETAVAEAEHVIKGAHAEANGAWNGIGLVKLMGRHSGFIAAHATLANSDVNFCLVPEVRFSLDGFLHQLEERILTRQHAVVVVAEGAGQELLDAANAGAADAGRDASGNVKLGDIGVFLRDAITRRFAERHIETTVKYIDPSYTIRSVPANSADSEYCLVLGQHAVHAAMAGRTNVMIGSWNQSFVHVPIAVSTGRRKQIDPSGDLWRSVLQATGQAACMLG